MIVTLNGYTTNDGVSPVSLDVQIDGLDLPDIRTSSGDLSGGNGSYVGGQFLAGRSVGMQGWVHSVDVATLETARKAFQTALTSNWNTTTRQFTVTVQIVTNAGNTYVIYANLIDLDMPLTRDLFRCPFNLELLATDVLIYDNTAGTALSVPITRQTAGGYTYPVTYPVVYAAGSLPTTVSNSGTAAVYPVVTLTNIMTNPVVTNTTTGSFIGLSPLTTAAGDVVTIDMRQHTILLNGGSIYGLQTPSSAWFSLLPGNNSISLTTSSGSDTVTGTVSWRPGYASI